MAEPGDVLNRVIAQLEGIASQARHDANVTLGLEPPGPVGPPTHQRPAHPTGTARALSNPGAIHRNAQATIELQARQAATLLPSPRAVALGLQLPPGRSTAHPARHAP